MVSGTARHTKINVKKDRMAYNQNAPVIEISFTMVRNEDVIARQAIHRLMVAIDIARPRMRVGKSSEIKTHTPGPRPTAKQPT